MKTLHYNQSAIDWPESRQARLQEDTRYKVLQILQSRPEISQRKLARELGISLGAINYCLRALIEKGQVKIEHFQRSREKLGYAYILTPHGVIEKSRIAKRFLERKILDYENLKKEIDIVNQEILNDVNRPGF